MTASADGGTGWWTRGAGDVKESLVMIGQLDRSEVAARLVTPAAPPRGTLNAFGPGLAWLPELVS
ncbi:hypothetical protein [Kibdelosporangium aridum]